MSLFRCGPVRLLVWVLSFPLANSLGGLPRTLSDVYDPSLKRYHHCLSSVADIQAP
jgi:hypothetical protein